MITSGSALIALGANMAHKGVSGPALLSLAVEALRAAGLGPRALSGIWETEPWPASSQPLFYNAAAELDPGPRSPQELYAALRAIELEFGRERRERWGPRTLDLDILAMEGFAGEFGELTLPHKRLHERAFVLCPLAEVAPGWRHPLSGRSVGEMLQGLPENQKVRRWGPFGGD